MVDLNGHEAGNGGHSQGKPTAHRDSSTRRDGMLRQPSFQAPLIDGEPLLFFANLKLGIIPLIKPATCFHTYANEDQPYCGDVRS